MMLHLIVVHCERLYYTDCYRNQFQATVIAADVTQTRLYLDKTAFYPTSGGQPHDLGRLNGAELIDVIDEGDVIVHVLAEPLAAQHVTGTVNWPRRYDHMQQHTGQHLLSAIFANALGCATLSVHIGNETSTIDLTIDELNEAQMNAVEDQVNNAARNGAPVNICFEDAEEAGGLRKPSERTGPLRIVTIAGWDRSACGGTHVRNISEVLPIQLRRTEKMRGNMRVEFVCGDRAIRSARHDLRILTQLTRLAGCSTGQTIDHFHSLRRRLADAEKDRATFAKQLAARAGADLYAATEPSPDGVRRASLSVTGLDDSKRAIAQAFGVQPKAVLLLFSSDTVLIVCSPDSGYNAAALLKAAIAECGGSGGGSPVMAQGRLKTHGECFLAKLAGLPDEGRHTVATTP